MAIDPVTLSAMGSGADFLKGALADYFSDDPEKALALQERIAKGNLQLGRDQQVLDLIDREIAAGFDNDRRRKLIDTIIAPALAKSVAKGASPSRMTEARNRFAARNPERVAQGSDLSPDQVSSLTHRNFQEFQRAKEAGRSRAATMTTDNLFVERETPMDALQREFPTQLQRMRVNEGWDRVVPGVDINTGSGEVFVPGKDNNFRLSPEDLEAILRGDQSEINRIRQISQGRAR